MQRSSLKYVEYENEIMMLITDESESLKRQFQTLLCFIPCKRSGLKLRGETKT